MRLICLFTLIVFFVPYPLPAQDPVGAAMRVTTWPDSGMKESGLEWSCFSRQYYTISDWNATGISAGYSSDAGHSAIVVIRDGIPGFAWYHLYLSHYRRFNNFGAMLQLRFSTINLRSRPPAIRVGGNLHMSWTMSESLGLQVLIYDFPGWILPMRMVTGDPALDLLIVHEPGRQIGLAGGFRISQLQFGPVTSGIRFQLNEKISLTALLNILPVGVSIGMNWNLGGYKIKGWFEQRSGLGITPTVEILHRRADQSNQIP